MRTLLPRLLTALLTVLAGGLLVVAPAPAHAATAAAAACPLAAHRGYTAHATENSLRAFKYAIARGADYLEMDVQVTKDGRFTLMHDRTVDRTTNGTGRISDKIWAQVSALRLNDGYPVPTLNQVLDLAKPSGTQILLEMKWIPRSRFAALHRLVTGYGVSSVVVHSFSRYVVQHYRSAYPESRTGLDVAKPVAVADVRSFGGVLPDYRHVTDAWLHNLRAAGVPTYLSTLNSLDAWRRFTGKVTLVVTDRVIDYAAYRDKTC